MARVGVLLAGIAAILICDSPAALAGALAVIVFPMLVASSALKLYLRFVIFILAPIGLALFIVWGVVVKAPPGQPLGSSPTDGMLFAALITLRIALLSGIFQAFFGGIRGEELIRTLAAWGITGDLRVIILATFAMVPEGKLRANQVLSSRLARGLVRRRSWINNGLQIPLLLRPMLGWTLRSAIERAELWDHRHLLERLHHNSEHEPPYAMQRWPACTFPTSSYECSSLPADVDSVDSVITETVTSFTQLAERTNPGRIIALIGNNFSGRTRSLRALTGLEHFDTKTVARQYSVSTGAYVGPEVHSAMSGLARTVTEELALHAGGKIENSSVATLVNALQLNALASRNPVTLSGGEQACVALSCALAMQPQVIAVDCAFEQLDPSLRSNFLIWLSEHRSSNLASIIADNRFNELGLNERKTFSNIEIIDGQLEETQGTNNHSLTLISGSSINYRLSSSPFEFRADRIGFAYDSSREVLRDVSMSLSPGNVYILEGANGSGKSTLAKLFCGVLKKEAGQFYRDEGIYNPWEIPGRHVAYHFQNPDVQLFSTTVLEEVAAGAYSHDFSPDYARDYALHLLEVFGLMSLADIHPLDLPFVLRKRVAMAATLASGCPWVILDEPTLGQDQNYCHGIWSMIEKVIMSGVGFIIISHSISFKTGINNSITFPLYDGTIRTTEDTHA